MNRSLFVNVSLFGGLIFFVFCPEALATSSNVILSEVQTAGEKADDEFIELYNQSSASFDISGFQLRRRTSSGTESSIKVFDKSSTLPGHGYFLWANSKGIFASPFADAETSSSALADNNSIGLFTKSGASGVLVDSIAWGNGALFDATTPVFGNLSKGKSLTRNTNTLSWSLTDTPSSTNSRGEVYVDPTPLPPPPPVTYIKGIRLNEFLPNPSSDEGTNEFIELYNPSDETVDLSLWSIKDSSTSGKYIFPDSTKIKSKDFLVVYRSVFKFALNNSDETIFLLDPNNEGKDTVSYKTSKEDVSWNYTLSGWRGGTPTPGAPNQPNALPDTREKVPKKGYHGVAIDFDAQGKDTDNDTLKYTWDFGDGHKSYKESTTHIYEENGIYTVTLKVSDGKDDTEETFTLKIESFPRPEVRITSFLANPSGSDTGSEWLIIENREKKAVDLKDYGIATGWKRLSNHPIREDFIIKPKSEAKLTHDFSLFTLPNQKGKIELRTPDGKVLQEIKYKLDKPMADNVPYQKKKGQKWTFGKSTTKNVSLPIATITDKQNKTVPPKTVPVEILPQPTDILEEEKVPEGIPTPVSLEPRHLDPRILLAYGTHVKVPHNITLASTLTERAVSTSIAPSSRESLLLQINAYLNEFFNRTH